MSVEAKLPGLCVSEGFIESIEKEVKASPGKETGGYIFGLKQNGNIFPVGTYTPERTKEIFKSGAHLSIGGQSCLDFYDWQLANWPKWFSSFLEDFGQRLKRIGKSTIEYDPNNPGHQLQLLGIWHKHPGGMISYSYDDDRQVDKHLDMGMEDYLFPIVVEKGGAIDIQFYFRSRKDRLTKTLNFKEDRILDSDFFPSLSPSPWYVENPELFDEEGGGFKKAGCEAWLVIGKAENGNLLSRIVFEVTRNSCSEPLYLETDQGFHNNGVFYLVTKLGKIGMIKSANQTMAELIKPFLDYQFVTRNKKEEENA